MPGVKRMTRTIQTRMIAPDRDSQNISWTDANVRPPPGRRPWGYHSRMNRWRWAAAAVLMGLLVAGSACSAPKEPIVVDEGVITVENLTSREWRNVKVTVNDYFNGGAPALLPGSRL